MIEMTHFNDKRPALGEEVLVHSRGNTDTRIMSLGDYDPDVLFDDDDFEFREAMWWEVSCDNYFDVAEYPWWSPIDKFSFVNKSGKDHIVTEQGKSEGEFTIPGYKIVGGCVVKA